MKQFIPAIKYLLLFVIGITLLVLAFKGQDVYQLIADLKKADYKWVFASLVACFIAHIIRVIRWRAMITSLGHGTPSLLNAFYAVMIGYMANVAFPRMGEVSRCGVINKTDNIPIVKLIGTVIVERIVDLLMLAIVLALGIMLQFDLLSDFLYKNVLIKLNGSAGNLTILIFATLILILAIGFLYLLLKKKKLGIRNRIYKFFLDVKSGILSVKDLENKGGFVLSSIFIWFLYGLSTYFCFFALDSTSGLGGLASLSVLVFSSLGMIVPVQGGIGAFHYMVSEGLVVYDIPKSEGLAYALLIHSSQTLLVLFAGAISVILLMLKSSKPSQNGKA
ncbi:lysylphosphatidylglycerol synthase transmembrane domain-containing protein [Daejeonella sp.]|uniref:lysylphosphatidylglycerol synthase transmembrane domain-containing protein n=1 Tax=Daejeonella sp. TaxID=2805397 RepID=UPI0030BD1CB9